MTASGSQAPVYVPYATLISALDALRAHGIPRTGKIDKTIWDSQSGTIQAQLMLGFRFLGLIDEQRNATPVLQPLVQATGEDRKVLLRKLIEEKYHHILSLDLTSISQGQLDEAFRAFEISGSTLTRATRFFVKACVELGIPIAKRFSERSKPTGIRKRRATISSSPRVQEQMSNGTTHNGTGSAWEERLLEKFPAYDPSWSDELKTKWFEGFERLMKSKI
jgi:hypothetical protein